MPWRIRATPSDIPLLYERRGGPPSSLGYSPSLWKKGWHETVRLSDGVVVIFIFLWRRRFTLSPGTTTSPSRANAYSGTPSFIKKENIQFVVDYADTSTALWTLHSELWTKKHYRVFVTLPGNSHYFQWELDFGASRGDTRPNFVYPAKFNVQGSSPEREWDQNLELWTLCFPSFYPAGFARRLLLYERRSTLRQQGEVIVKCPKLPVCLYFFQSFIITLFYYNHTSWPDPFTITPSGFAIHPFFHKEGDGTSHRAPRGGIRTKTRRAFARIKITVKKIFLWKSTKKVSGKYSQKMVGVLENHKVIDPTALRSSGTPPNKIKFVYHGIGPWTPTPGLQSFALIKMYTHLCKKYTTHKCRDSTCTKHLAWMHIHNRDMPPNMIYMSVQNLNKLFFFYGSYGKYSCVISAIRFSYKASLSV